MLAARHTHMHPVTLRGLQHTHMHPVTLRGLSRLYVSVVSGASQPVQATRAKHAHGASSLSQGTQTYPVADRHVVASPLQLIKAQQVRGPSNCKHTINTFSIVMRIYCPRACDERASKRVWRY